MTVAEPDVTLTDYALALECALFAWLLYRHEHAGRLRTWFIVFFCAAAFAALAGGTEHGFLLDDSTPTHAAVWKSTLLAIGVSALAAWMIGAYVQAAGMRWIRAVAPALFAGYVIAVCVSDDFVVAIIHYLPAALFLLIVFWMQYGARRDRAFLWGTLGMLLTFVAAGIQQGRIGVHPVWFNHNALYHLIQAAAFLLLFVAARGIIRRQEAR